jgi:hypothetical protein
MHQQLWGYKVEEKLYVGVREQKRLNTTGIEYCWMRCFCHWPMSCSRVSPSSNPRLVNLRSFLVEWSWLCLEVLSYAYLYHSPSQPDAIVTPPHISHHKTVITSSIYVDNCCWRQTQTRIANVKEETSWEVERDYTVYTCVSPACPWGKIVAIEDSELGIWRCVVGRLVCDVSGEVRAQGNI